MPRATIDPRDALIACIAPSTAERAFLSACSWGRCELLMTEHLYTLVRQLLTAPESRNYVYAEGVDDFLDEMRAISEVRPEPLDVRLRDFEAYFIAFGRQEKVSFAVSGALVSSRLTSRGVRVLSAADALQEV